MPITKCSEALEVFTKPSKRNNASTKLKVNVASNNLNTQTHLEKEHQARLESISINIKEISTAIGEIREQLDHFNKRFIILEQQQNKTAHTTPLASATNSTSIETIENNNTIFPVEITRKEETQRSTCFLCAFFGRKCTLYFDDLYRFDTKTINTEIGADPIRLQCPCKHLIRYHERNPNSLETELPAFANPPLRQRLYEDWVPPLFQGWINYVSAYKKKCNELEQADDLTKED
ncbi:unnamed protein product [Rotaria socialis]|uniref:Uncharacterized protein n=1 Tax=Rotaria socialis TaxID=392032 RepID=A0A817T0K1_9BILA|nr:unnamed protein product [Rotaria socialis]CAF3580069.1 unnamed protein product [Rotaria socialis]